MVQSTFCKHQELTQQQVNLKQVSIGKHLKPSCYQWPPKINVKWKLFYIFSLLELFIVIRILMHMILWNS